MTREWFQDNKIHPHYDLVESGRNTALNLGAVSVLSKEQDRRRLATVKEDLITKEYREALSGLIRKKELVDAYVITKCTCTLEKDDPNCRVHHQLIRTTGETNERG